MDAKEFKELQIQSLEAALEEARREGTNWETVQDYCLDVANAITDGESPEP